MSSFKIDFGPDWAKIKKAFATDQVMQRAIPDISISILKLNNVLEQRVADLFNAPAKLSSVMIGHANKPSELGATFIRYSLQYRYKPIPLIDFGPFGVIPSSSVSIAPLRANGAPLGAVNWQEGKYSKVLSFNVRRGKPTGARVGGNFSKQAAFAVIGNPYIKDGIYARATTSTWDRYPTKGNTGTRSNYVQLFGPSLSQQAAGVFAKDKKVAAQFNIMQTDILNAIVKAYQNG